MSLENLDAGGNANAEPSAAPPSESPSGGTEGTGLGLAPALEPAPATEPTIDSGVQPPADLTTEQPTDDEQEAALVAVAEDPNTPQFAREKIKQAMALAGQRKETLATYEQQLNELKSQYEGREVLPPDELTRLKTNDEQLYALQAFTSTPEQRIEAIRNMTGQHWDGVQNQLVWSAVTNTDGTPNLANLQVLVDSFAGEPGKVKAEDVMSAVNALKSGEISAADFQKFDSPEQFEAYQRAQAAENAAKEREAQANANMVYLEEQARGQAVNQAMESVQQNLYSQIDQRLAQFKLAPIEGEPKQAADFKALVREQITQLVNGAGTDIRELGELAKAVSVLQKSQDKPMSAADATAQVQQFFNDPRQQVWVNKGISALMTKVEGRVAQLASHYALMMKGLEVENSKGQTARPIPGQAGQVTNGLPNLTAEELQRLSSAERQDHLAQQLSEAFRAQGQGSRLG